jgi:outer membrane protein
MKQFSLVLNLLLFLAVGFLYYLHFRGHQKSSKKNSLTTNCPKDSCAAGNIPVIAYVELDSINNNVGFIKERKKELDAEQKVIATAYENAYRGLEDEKNNFLKKGNSITQQEAEAFQEKLGQKQQQIESEKQVQGQKLAEKGSKVMEDMQRRLKDFMNDYNKDKRYTYILATGTGLDYLFYKDSVLNITAEVVKGLNEKMKEPEKK